MVQAAEDRMSNDPQVYGNVVPVCLLRHRQGRRWLRNDRSQGHMGTAHIVMPDPRVQQASQMTLRQWDDEIQHFSTEGS